MTENELAQLLGADGELVTEQLDRWSRERGSNTFLFYGETGTEMSFADVAQRTDAISGNLQRLGIGKGDHVSVFCTNSLLAALSMFGIWKAGAVYCPINFSYTGRLLEYQLNDTSPRLVITEPDLLPALNEVASLLEDAPKVSVCADPINPNDADVPSIDGTYGSIAWSELTSDCSPADVKLDPSDAANLIYTSGTTGPAKGVLLPHRWMAQYTFLSRKLCNENDVIYNDLPMYHVGGAVFNICRAAWLGCEVAIWNRFSPDSFWSRIAERKATTAVLLDVMIPWLMKAPAGADDRRNTLNKVHMQPLPLDHAVFADRFGIDHVTAGFGQTETGNGLIVMIRQSGEGEGTPSDLYFGPSHAEIAQTMQEINVPVISPEQAERKGIMGVPSPFVEVSVRREDDSLCDTGEIGHLTLRPKLPNIFLQTYWRKPEATADALRNLWFHTGDAAFLGEDGFYYYNDRLGDRIRVRGENLSSFQVEDLLNRHPGVRMSAVVGVPSEEGNEDDIAAFVIATSPDALSEDIVRAYATENMPKYMRPRFIRIVDDLPRTPTNKVEKYKLRKLIVEG
ncbi:class I adenylate-forming enzyme family protein [Altererythrobacter sp.]|uniref:class I adenylate-forming enzyme family protein n=1 Tax=Altererythrobacter sp. TaxID=1872480 RepID=UPI003D03B766